MGSTVTHSRRPRDRPPCLAPALRAFWPLSSPLLYHRTHSATSLFWSADSCHDPEHGKGHAVSTTQNPHLCAVPAGINIRPKAAVTSSCFLPCIASEITRTRERIESDQELCVVAPRSTARPDPSTVDESIKSMA